MREWLSAWDDFELEAEGFRDAGDSVVVPFRVRARGKSSGARVDRRWAHVWTFRHGKVVRFEVRLDIAAALAAVGLRE
jgi:ketosteroid isomerase-like protein